MVILTANIQGSFTLLFVSKSYRAMADIKPIFEKGYFIKNKDPYEGEGEYLVVDFDYNGKEWHGYKCARMKGKHVSNHDFDNHLIIDKWAQNNYKRVG